MPTTTCQGPCMRIGMLLLPQFNSFAAHAFVDPFRAANYLRVDRIFQREFLSPVGGSGVASNEIEIVNTRSPDDLVPEYDLVVVNASWAPERSRSGSLQRWLRSASRQGVSLGGIDTGAFVLAFAGLLGPSVRQVQRIFKKYIGVAPIRYYLNVRLDRAHALVTQTELPIAEIAALCGFGQTARFSRAYSRRFDIAPVKDRIEGRIPFQFHKITDRAGYHSMDWPESRHRE